MSDETLKPFSDGPEDPQEQGGPEPGFDDSAEMPDIDAALAEAASDLAAAEDEAAADLAAAEARTEADIAAAEAVGDAELAAAEAEVAVDLAAAEMAADEGAMAAEAVVEAEAEREADPVEELRDALRYADGEWYVVHSYAGYERRVKQNIEVAITNQNLEEEIFQIEVPMETVTEIKKGERKRVERVKLPGYVLVRMEHTPRSWTAIRNTPGVTGFVGHGNNPAPLTLDEVVSMLAPPAPVRTAAETRTAAESAGEPAARVASGGSSTTTVLSEYGAGDVVTVIDGPFESLQATISEVNAENQRVTAMVELFGRDTPVELRFDQITTA